VSLGREINLGAQEKGYQGNVRPLWNPRKNTKNKELTHRKRQ
jgi:hypothetical protein